MGNRNALSIDVGTQSVRAIIFSQDGKIIASEKIPYGEPYFSLKPGYSEQNVDYFYDKICEACRKVKEKDEKSFDSIVGLSLSCFRDTPVILDENYKPIRPAIMWLDQRRAKCEKNYPLLTRLMLFVSGMRKTADLNRKRTVANWLQENEPDNWSKMRHYWNISTYFIYRLTGSCFDTASSYTGHYPINMKKRRWQKPYEPTYPVFGVNPKFLPDLKLEGSILGDITPRAEKETGIKAGAHLYSAAADKSCETLGLGCIDSSLAAISYGTACSVEMVNDKYKEPETFLPAYSSPVPGLYDMEVQVYRGYWMLEWFAKNFASEEITTAVIEKIAVEEILNKKMLSIPPGSDGLILQPYWGPGLKRPLARGAILGFSDFHTKIHLYRAIIEGIAYALKEGLDSIQKKAHKKVKGLMVSGGGSKSNAICQITADIFNLPVSRVQTYETASLGAAITVFVSSGIYKDYTQAIACMVHKSDTFTPNKENVMIYRNLFNKVYKRIYPDIKQINYDIRKYTSSEDKE